MKTLLICAAVAALVWSTPAFADDNDHHDNRGHQGTQTGRHPAGGPGQPGGGHSGMSGPMMGPGNGAGTHAHVDLHTYQRNFRAPHRFHIGVYHAPRGYHYRRWTYGERLPSIFFGRDYWIGDFGAYGLMPPPPGYVWVRYGPDALLIDEYTGEIVQVQYGAFY